MQTWIAEQAPLQITECLIESAFLEKAPNLGTLHAPSLSEQENVNPKPTSSQIQRQNCSFTRIHSC